MILFKCFDYEMPLCLKATNEDLWEGQDMPRSTAVKGDLLAFLCLQGCKDPEPKKEMPNLIQKVSMNDEAMLNVDQEMPEPKVDSQPHPSQDDIEMIE